MLADTGPVEFTGLRAQLAAEIESRDDHSFHYKGRGTIPDMEEWTPKIMCRQAARKQAITQALPSLRYIFHFDT